MVLKRLPGFRRDMSLGERLIKENGKRKRGFHWLGGGEGEKMSIVRV